MLQKYADIIVNISHEALDKTFQYVIPESLHDRISIGDLVNIPFGKGNKIIKGYVVAISDTPEYESDKLKSILSIETDSALVEDKLIKLAAWMKETYGSTMINALKTVLPIRRKIKEKENRTIRLLLDIEEAKSQLYEFERKKRTARKRLLEALILEGELDYSLVTGKLSVSSATISAMEELGIVRVCSKRIYRDTVHGEYRGTKNELNEYQRPISDSIIEELKKGDNTPCLIRGITGSGKTEVYMEVIDYVIAGGAQVIVLIPEIALTFQTVMRFYHRFGDRVSTLHSRLSQGERYDQFEKAKRGDIDIMIGPRSALFTPFANLGLVIIDEEHENSYKSDSAPKYHARDVALKLCELHGAKLILGSATPSIDSYYRARMGEYRLYTIDNRALGAELPKVTVVDMREELNKGNRSIFSNRLRTLIEERLNRNEQIMLFLNRRGYAGFITCRACGHVIKCPHCDVSLTRHGGNSLICHYCGYTRETLSKCPECSSTMIGEMRLGTEKIEEYVKKAFPQATVLRMDADTTKDKEGYERILSSFANREADILVGTQMIVKGHDFPYVTLVGVLAADMSLYANDYRACERTFQLLTQAEGRAGRGSIAGEAVIQTYNPEHYSILSSAGQDYEAFYEEEIAYRKLLSYPPVYHMLAILIESMKEGVADEYSRDLAEMIRNDIMKFNVSVIGPADATIKKISDVYRRVIYIKSTSEKMLKTIRENIEKYEDMRGEKHIRLSFDFDPMNGY